MKKYLLTATFSFASCVALFAQSTDKTTSLAIGSKLPEEHTSFQATDGNAYTLKSQLKTNGLIVMFSCNTCPYVLKSQQRTKEVMAMAQKDKIGLVIVNSNVNQRDDADSYTAMQSYADEQEYTVPYIQDDNVLAPAFGATHTPEVFLFDGKGLLVYKGAMEDNPSQPSSSTKFYLSQAASSMLNGSVIDPNTTKSIGCSIKNAKDQ